MTASARVAVVSGGSRGIGRGIALGLAREGFDIGLVQRGTASDVRQMIEACGRRTCVVQADLRRPDEIADAVMRIAATLGRIDVAVANAGSIVRRPALELSLDDWSGILTINLTSVFAMSQAAARIFVDQGSGGCIVHIASVLAFQGGRNVCAYAASKGGVAQLTRALSNEWAPLGIRVNAVAPGYVDTELTRDIREDEVRNEEISGRIPLGRWGTPEDVAAAVSYLVSPSSAYVSGHVLTVDGGWLAG